MRPRGVPSIWLKVSNTYVTERKQPTRAAERAVALKDWPEVVARAMAKNQCKADPVGQMEKCHGCTGTCCTGIGSEPCVCQT